MFSRQKSEIHEILYSSLEEKTKSPSAVINLMLGYLEEEGEEKKEINDTKEIEKTEGYDSEEELTGEPKQKTTAVKKAGKIKKYESEEERLASLFSPANPYSFFKQCFYSSALTN